MIVADTNLIAYFLMKGEETASAQDVFQKDPDWRAPSLWRSEFRNMLALYLKRGTISMEEASRLSEEAEHLMQDGRPVETRRVLELALASGCTAYDCEFVALARDLGVPLVTSDSQILKAFPSVAVPLARFAA